MPILPPHLSRIEGAFFNGEPQGKCVCRWPSGDRYEGLFDKDAMVDGIYTFANGESVEMKQ